MFGCVRVLNVRKPAEKIWVLALTDLRCNEDVLAVDATAQLASLLRTKFTEHFLIFLTCLVTENGKFTLNFPCLFVLTSFRNLGLESVLSHSTATKAPEMKWLNLEKSLCKQVSQ